jgi:hypothetical protein
MPALRPLLHAPLSPAVRALAVRRPSAPRAAAMSDPDGWDAAADTVGAGIYSGRVKRDAQGAVVYGAQYAGHNPRPGPVYAGGGYTEIAQAIQAGPQAVAALLAAGADPEEEMTGGARPLHTCGMSQRGQHAVRLLLAASAAVDSVDTYGYTPLHRMASNNLVDGAKALIEAGADVNKLTSFSSQTPLFIAQISGARDVEQVLRDAGALEW